MKTQLARYKKARADYKYLVKHHDGNEPNDMAGGWNEGEQLVMILDNPYHEVAADIYISAIQYSASAGFENNRGSILGDSPDLKDKRTMSIYSYYGVSHLLEKWVDQSE